MVARQSEPMKMNHAYGRLHTKCGRKKGHLVRIIFENSPFLQDVMRYLMQTTCTPQRRQGQDSSGPGSLFVVNWWSRKSKLQCSPKAKSRVKITSRFRHSGLRLVRFVLQSSSIYSPFFMARFGMHELCACFSRHVHLHSACLSNESVLCGCMLWRHRKSFQSVYRLLERLSSFFVVLLTCCFACVCLFTCQHFSVPRRKNFLGEKGSVGGDGGLQYKFRGCVVVLTAKSVA